MKVFVYVWSLETRIVPCRVPSLLGEDCSIGGCTCLS